MQFTIPKPIDMFANDFLRFLNSKAEIVGDWKVKVLYCTDSFWAQLHPIQKKLRVWKPDEYVKKPSTKTLAGWQKVNGWNIQLAGKEANGCLVWTLTAEEREITLTEVGFQTDLAQQLSQFHAVIFLNARNIVNAQRNGWGFASFMIVAHEVLHIAERLSEGKVHMSTWDADKDIDAPEVLEYFREFAEAKSIQEFGDQYLKPCA